MEITNITSPTDWSFFAKGAANILFKYTGSNDYLKDKLLRLRLRKEISEYISTCELYDFIELKCKSLFPHHIIDLNLVLLTSAFVSGLDTHGHELMLSEQYGLLTTNCLWGAYQKLVLSNYCSIYVGSSNAENMDPSVVDTVIIDMKPKWLYDNACNYCRTCLLNQAKGFKRHFCPLDLLYPETIGSGIEDIMSKVPREIVERIEDQNRIPLSLLFKRFVSTPDNVLQKLKQYQKIVNKDDLILNLKSMDDVLERLSLIMTLRDVGLFVKFEKYDALNDTHSNPDNAKNVVLIGNKSFFLTSRIYDLDLKSKLKYKHWLDVEERLQRVYNSTNPNWKFCVKMDS